MSKAKSTEKVFYCYVILDGSKPGNYTYGKYKFKHEPIYVGKGCNKRSNAHIKEALATKEDGSYKYTNHKVKRIRKILRAGFEVIVKHSRNLGTEAEAFAREIDMIDRIGRRNTKEGRTGPLTNGTRGGAGAVGRVESAKVRAAKSVRMKAYVAIHGSRSTPHTEEMKEHFRKLRLGTKLSEKHKKKIGDTQRGIPKPWVSKANTGRKLSTEWCKAISDGQRGNKRSEEANENNRIAQLNRRKPTPEQAKITAQRKSAKLKGVPKSKEHRRKISEAQIGKKPTEEALANQRLGQQRRWKRYREEKSQKK